MQRGKGLLCLALCEAMACRFAVFGEEPGSAKAATVDCCYYRKTSEYDPGTIRVYLRNGEAYLFGAHLSPLNSASNRCDMFT